MIAVIQPRKKPKLTHEQAKIIPVINTSAEIVLPETKAIMRIIVGNEKTYVEETCLSTIPRNWGCNNLLELSGKISDMTIE